MTKTRTDPWNEKRLVLKYIFIGLGVVGFVAFLFAMLFSSPETPTTTSSPSKSASTLMPTAEPPAAPETESPTFAEPTAPDVTFPIRDRAEQAVRAWLKSDSDALAVIATPEFVEAMKTVDPANLPTGTISSSTVVVEADGMARVMVALSSDTVVNVDLQLLEGQWYVTDIIPGG